MSKSANNSKRLSDLFPWLTICAGGLAYLFSVQGGFFAVLITLPVIAAVFLTYRAYLKNIEAAASRLSKPNNTRWSFHTISRSRNAFANSSLR
ncbi:MAG: hypothetical protein H0V18_13850 [Pyrinomonadaceae bacterium]|nr:hypothetical protein [Pyrinomonadaceae bacterium]